MEDLIILQSQLKIEIQKLVINFKKDSAHRKTARYLKRRLNSLQSLWSEFEANNTLLNLEEDKSAAYFTEEEYASVKKIYDEGIQLINNTKPYDEEDDDESRDKGSPSKTDELMSQQNTNFRALHRVIKNIRINDLNERWEIEDKLQMLQSRWKVVDEQHWKIDNLLEGADEVYEGQFSRYEQLFEKTKTELYRKLNSVKHQVDSTPHLELPTFAGSYSSWPAFSDLYCEAIHNNPTLNKCQKMQHLKGKLKGEAERLVQHLTISAENYDTCWDILNRRYNNVQLLFTKLMQTFMNQPTMQKHTAFEIKRIHDISLETVHAIHNLGVDTTSWDPILVHIITEKMDPETYTAYMDARKNKRDLPSFEELINVLECKFTALEPLNKKTKQNKHNAAPAKENEPKHKDNMNDTRIKFAKSYKTFERACPLCKAKDHVLLTCKRFLNMTPETKVYTIKSLALCENCLFYHKNNCTSIKKCKVCNDAHHTILHEALCNKVESNADPKPSTSVSNSTNSSQRKSYHAAGNYDEILLATIELKIRAKDGTYMPMRCLLDQGSQINLITESAAQRLGLERCNQKASVFGVGSSATHSNGAVQLVCESRYNNYTFVTEALVMPRVIGNLPNFTFERQPWAHLHNISLADPEFNISRPVDILLDAKVYAEILMDGILRGPANAPIAQQTQLGWILVGNVKTFNCHAVLHNLEEISQYWEMEEITQHDSNMTPEQDYCETLYQTTTKRHPDGRYEVKLPMKPNFEEHLAPSKPQAIAQFKQLEKRLAKDEVLSESYKDFMNEYKQCGHMKLCTLSREPSCYLPHHGVLRLDSLTTKLRTVFNASCKLKTGYSLNELMECGPNLQKDLQGLLLLWRKFEFVYTADIEKFYRQILINEADQHLQKIVWRDSTSDHLSDYQLCTVTYGTKAAPYLAMRTIKQLVQDDGEHYPLAVDILNNQLYVDDLLGGSNEITEAQNAQQQIINILRGGGFNLRKWASNDTRLLQNLPQHLISQNMFDFKHAETNKTLGLSWNPCSDQFTFRRAVPTTDKAETTTKRTLLSNISKIFDPLGWLSPVTITGKLIFQKVWNMKLNWDDDLPQEVQQEWDIFKQDLVNISNISIDRWMGDTKNSIELHGFCDASEKAYGCVIYCKSISNDGRPVIKLVAGKTKLAPLNKPITLPRLELSGALLLSQLMKKVVESINIQTRHVIIHGWTDSMVVLGWLQGDIGRWKTFVANRVEEIKNIMPSSCWKHIKSAENPADCASRGLLPSQLLTYSLWWEGPEWLKGDDIPQQPVLTNISVPEEKKKQKACVARNDTKDFIVEPLLERHSSMNRAVRVLAWVLRFIHNIRNKDNRPAMNLKVNEIRNAHNTIIRAVQHKHFCQDIEQLSTSKKLHRKSRLLNLNPWIDHDGILRVGGRLENSNLNNEHKHPMIVPNDDHLSILLIRWAHNMTLHGGAKLTLTYLRTKYWMLGGMHAVKKELQKCVKCLRFKASSKSQLMADLPKPRVTPSRPFTHTGVDLAGPVDVKSNKGRGIASTKGYIAIFICLATKAIHLELISDLTSITFLAALKRLCARRGTPQHMYSDCGTNFIGAARSLQHEHKTVLKQYLAFPGVMEELANHNIEWHFNAPSWPTAGGLWEAAVKRMKHHLKRVIGEQKLTFEEFITLLTQIEACLNSRPLVALTNSIEDLECLTPGHFLTGDLTLAPPLIQEVEDISLGTRWRLTEKMHKDFWRKWSTVYLQTLQTRSKWFYSGKDLQVGDLVIIKEDNIPPARWLLGRVILTHPGNDGRVRVVTLKTKNSDGVKRPVNKLIHLPVEPEASHLQSQKQPEQNPETKSNNNQQRQRKSKKKGFSSLLNIFMLLFVMVTTTTGAQTSKSMEVTTLDQNQPLYFDKVAELQVIQDEWKMVVYYNLTSYWHSLANMEYYVNFLHDLSKEEPAFNVITSQLKHEVTELQHYNTVLRDEHGRRSKRGLINGIGYVANSLFGILDDQFAVKYDHDIKTIQQNENHLLNLYKQQTSIIEGEYNILKRHEEVMVTQFASISKQIADLNNLITDERKRSMYITATTLTATLIINNLRRLQQELLDLVTDVRSGRMDTHLLSPEEFENQLNIIAAQIPNDIALPCTSAEEYCIREMYKLSRVHVKLTTFLIFEVKLPLLNIEPFELSRVIPIPRVNQLTLSATYFRPTAKYSALNLKKDMIIPMTEEDVHTGCISFREKKLLCRLNLPIHTTAKEVSTLCEAQIINNKNLSSCGTVAKACSDDWIMLHSRTAWLFTCCQECAVRIFCTDTVVMSKTLNGTGIISILPGCMMKGDNIIIHSPKTYRTDVTIHENETQSYLPEAGINNILRGNNYTYIPETHETQLIALQKQINTVKASQDNMNTISISHEAHHYVIYVLIALAGVLVISIRVCRNWKRWQIDRRNNPTQDVELQSVRSSTTTSGIGTQAVERHAPRRINKQTSP